MYPGYEPVKILDTFAKIYDQQVYHHASKDEYSIERTYGRLSSLVPLLEIEQKILNELLAFEKCVYDAQDRQDDESKEAGREAIHDKQPR